MSKPKHPGGRPKLPDHKRRVHLTCTVAPGTKRILDGIARDGRSLGSVLDELVGTEPEEKK